MEIKVQKEKTSCLNDLLGMFEDELNVETVQELLATGQNHEIGLLDQPGMRIYD